MAAFIASKRKQRKYYYWRIAKKLGVPVRRDGTTPWWFPLLMLDLPSDIDKMSGREVKKLRDLAKNFTNPKALLATATASAMDRDTPTELRETCLKFIEKMNKSRA